MPAHEVSTHGGDHEFMRLVQEGRLDLWLEDPSCMERLAPIHLFPVAARPRPKRFCRCRWSMSGLVDTTSLAFDILFGVAKRDHPRGAQANGSS